MLCTVIGLTFLTSGSSAHACRGVHAETKTFLERLPPVARSKALVAKIEVVSSKVENAKITAEVRVLDAIKGTEKGKAIHIVIDLSSCSREPKVAPAQQFFIAGSIGSDGIFRGEWRGSEREQLASLNASATAGKVPLTVSFSITYKDVEVRKSSTVTIDFGDGSPVVNTTTESVIRHVYSIPGSYMATMSGCNQKVDLACDNVVLARETIRASDPTPPHITSLSPTAAFFGASLALKGRGIARQDSQIIIDHKYQLLIDIKPTDAGFSFFLSSTLADKDASCPQSPGGAPSTCQLPSYPLKEGVHSLSVKTANGISNEIAMTVKPYPGRAAFDSGTLMTSDRQPYLSGTAYGVQQIYLSIDAPKLPMETILVKVQDGHWSTKLNIRRPGGSPLLLPPGVYSVRISSGDPGTGMNLTGTTLRILPPQKISTKFNLRDTVTIVGEAKVFANPSSDAPVIKIMANGESATIDDDHAVSEKEKIFWKIQSSFVGWIVEDKLKLLSTAAANAAYAERALNPTQECIAASKKWLEGKITSQEAHKICGK
jgi:hypothetical protein